MENAKGSGDAHKDFSDYQVTWKDMMLNIWEDRMLLLGNKGSGKRISDDIDSEIQMLQESFSSLIAFELPPYAIYWMMGVGNGYTKGPDNGGDLEILDPVYRVEHNMNKRRLASTKEENRKTTGKPRVRHLQPIKSYSYSKRILIDACARIVGDAFKGAFTEINGEVNLDL